MLKAFEHVEACARRRQQNLCRPVEQPETK